MRNLPETTIIFLVYSPKLIIQSTALAEITSTNMRIWAQTEAYEHHAGRNSRWS
jgi:hypothetical protein